MGLDMYCYEVKRLTDEEERGLVGKKVEDIYNKGYNVFDVLDENGDLTDEEDKLLLEELVPYLSKIKVIVEYFDVERCRKDHNVPDDAYMVGRHYGNNEVGFTYYDNNDGHYEINMTEDEYNKYLYENEKDCLVGNMREIRYWRKDYGLQDEIYEACDRTIYNCGYYKLNEEMYDTIFGFDRSDDDYYPEYDEDDDTVGLFYHEWY